MGQHSEAKVDQSLNNEFLIIVLPLRVITVHQAIFFNLILLSYKNL